MTLIRLADCRDSKRMYDKRFREWNVYKNVDRDGKPRASRLSQGSASSVGPGDAGVVFNHDDLRKALQCAKTMQHGVTRAPVTNLPASLPVPDDICRESPAWPGRRNVISDLIKEESASSDKESSPETLPSSPDASYCCTPNTDSCLSLSDGLSPEQTGEPVALHRPAPLEPSLAIYKAQLHSLAMSPPPSLTPDAKTRTLGVITVKLQEYFDWQLSNIPEGVLPDDYLGHRASDESARYWGTVKDAIYLVKLSAGPVRDHGQPPDRCAWHALSEAGCLAVGAMTSHPFDFLRNLFATLSPANTSARPELRGIFLQFLARQAENCFSPNHPITRICQELQRDEGCQEISRRSLQCMLDVFNSRLGRSRAVTFKLLDSLATLLRRSGEFHAGMKIMTELLKSCRQVFGPHSDMTRSVESELAHFYMLAGLCDVALGHCMSVVTRPEAPDMQDEPCLYEDAIAVYAMEDIAEIYQRRGDVEQSVMWLRRAAPIAMSLWGLKAVATGHIIDKLMSMEQQFGHDASKNAALWETAVA